MKQLVRHLRLRCTLTFCVSLISVGALVVLVKAFLAPRYPMGPKKDWLDILSQVGGGAGILSLLWLIIENHWKEVEKRLHSTPLLKFIPYPSLVPENEVKNAGSVCWLCEEREDLLPKSESKYRDYRDLWMMLQGFARSATSGSRAPLRYVKIKVENHQIYAEGSAYSLALYIRVTYYMDIDSSETMAKEFWTPIKRVEISAGSSIFVYFPYIPWQNAKYMQVEILDYRCQNSIGRVFRSKDSGFSELPIQTGKVALFE